MAKGLTIPNKQGMVKDDNPLPVKLMDVSGNPVGEATVMEISNITATTADTEFSLALPDNTKQFSIKIRGRSGKLRLSVVSGQAGESGVHTEIPQGGWLSPGNLNLTDVILYFETSADNKIVEIITYS